MRRLALIAVALAACVASVPSMAAPPSIDFRVSAQSDELRPLFAAVSANDEANAIVFNNRASHPILAAAIGATIYFVGSRYKPSYRTSVTIGIRRIDYS